MTSDWVIASPTSAEVARSPSSTASLSALLLSRFARMTRSPPCTRLWATVVPSIPTPMIAVVISFPSSLVESGATHSCKESQWIPVFAIVNNEAITIRYEGCITHIVRIAVANDFANHAPFRDDYVLVVGRVGLRCWDFVNI